jgi:hypothetical protein
VIGWTYFSLPWIAGRQQSPSRGGELYEGERPHAARLATPEPPDPSYPALRADPVPSPIMPSRVPPFRLNVFRHSPSATTTLAEVRDLQPRR